MTADSTYYELLLDVKADNILRVIIITVKNDKMVIK